MSVAKILIEEIEAFAVRNPGHQNSADVLLKAVRKIDTQFTGETRDMLLSEARHTFLQQIQTLETAERTLESLKTLQTNQKKLVEALKRLAMQRPEGATLH
ncbi:MAG: hypothetical protein IH881_04765 [Myxococcales bacterium]|nr:hypothetical protein [Myxococcales bacterium]